MSPSVTLLVATVFAVIAVTTSVVVHPHCVEEQQQLTCKCINDEPVEVNSPSLLKNVYSFNLHDCKSAHLRPQAFLGATNLTQVRIQRVGILLMDVVLPSTVRELEFYDVAWLAELRRQTFAEVRNVTYLLIENSVVGSVERDLLDVVEVMLEVHFFNVTFDKLPSNAMVFPFGEPVGQTNAPLVVEECTFVSADDNPWPMSTVNLVDVTFAGNVLDCRNPGSAYYMVWHLLEKQIMEDDAVHCSFLADNYCDSRKGNESRLSYRLFRDKKMSKTIGLQLSKVCPKLYEEYRRINPTENSANYLFPVISLMFLATSIVNAV